MDNKTESIDLDDIRIFVQVVRSGTFTGAARVLGLPKSSVSRRVAELEERLGARLLERTTRSVSLNDVGRLYYDRVSPRIDDLHDAARALQELDATPRGLLRITTPPDDGVTELVAAYQARYPEVSVALNMTTAYVDLVAEGYDLAIRARAMPDSTLVARPLVRSTGVLVASPAYLASHGSPARVADLSQHACLSLGLTPGAGTWTLIEDEKEVQVEVSGPLSSNSFVPLRQAALAGRGIALLPDFGLADDVEAGRLQQLLPGVHREESTLYAVYPSRRLLTAKVRAFVDFAIEWMGEAMGRVNACE